jgi:DNA-binding YbaB/EbfC family protein
MNPQKLMKQLQQKQERIQQEIAALQIEASSGGGMVTVVMDGQKVVKSLRIDPEVVSKDDVDMLQDLVLAAVNEAGRKVDEAVQEKMAGLTAGLNIPGLF